VAGAHLPQGPLQKEIAVCRRPVQKGFGRHLAEELHRLLEGGDLVTALGATRQVLVDGPHLGGFQ
jgi:hypothetical protein